MTARLIYPLRTERLLLRPYGEDDLDELAGVFTDPEVMRFVGSGARTREQTAEVIVQANAHEREHGFSVWAVIEAATGRLLGECGLNLLDGTGPRVEVGYVLGRAFWGRGYATEAARESLRAGFVELCLPSIVAVADPRNFASLHVIDKLGMRYLGAEWHYGADLATYVLDGKDWGAKCSKGRGLSSR